MVIDYVLVKKCDHGAVKDVKVIRSEPCIKQHKLMVCVLDLKETVIRKRRTFESKCKIWRLKDVNLQRNFCDKVQKVASERQDGEDLERMWKGLKDCLLQTSDQVCGRSKGAARHKETWWWNKDIEIAVKEKRRLYVLWDESRSDQARRDYCKARAVAKKMIGKAKAAERQKTVEMLENEDAKGNIFRIAKQMVKKNRDVVGGGCVKDVDCSIVVDDAKTMEIWKRYYEKLLNEEFDWNKNNLENVNAVCGARERISTSEVRAAIAKSKSGKAAGPSGVVAEMLKASGEKGEQWVTDICNKVVMEGCIPENWTKSWMVNVYKGNAMLWNVVHTVE